MPKVKTAISIDDTLLAEAVSIAQELDIPKSRVISLALEDFIRHHRNKQLLDQINEAYADAPDSEDVSTLEIIRSQRRKLGEHDEWK
jgi:Arc/MetJ family transcription regulator